MTNLPQQNTLTGYTPLKRQTAQQHGQKAGQPGPLTAPPRSFNPRPGH